jgi:hypothetical protein
MSKQQSLMPEEGRAPGTKSRKPTPWVLWCKLNWRQRLGREEMWWRIGRYRSKEVAVQAKKHSSLRDLAQAEFRIRHEDEGAPT